MKSIEIQFENAERVSRYPAFKNVFAWIWRRWQPMFSAKAPREFFYLEEKLNYDLEQAKQKVNWRSIR